MKRIATAVVLSLALLAFGKFSAVGTHWQQVVADQGDDSGNDGGDDAGDDSGT